MQIRSAGNDAWSWWHLFLLFLVLGAVGLQSAEGDEQRLTMLVMDPLCADLACACVDGYAQRDYQPLANLIERQTGWAVTLSHGFSMAAATEANGGQPFDLVVGKQSVVIADADRAGRRLRPVAMLRGLEGSTNLHGLFVVRSDDPAEAIADLADRAVLFGPKEAFEKHQAGINAMHRDGVQPKLPVRVVESCAMGALAVVQGEADATVISSYAQPLLVGCETIAPDALRIIGRTESVPFITLFVDESLPADLIGAVRAAARMVREDEKLSVSLETRGGFVLFGAVGDQSSGDGLVSAQQGWTGFMGPRRDGRGAGLPPQLPDAAHLLWQSKQASRGIGGIAANARWVVVAGRSEDNTRDRIQAFDADTGQQLWVHEYEAPGELDYGASPRATPLIHAGSVYALGALGHLRCLSLATGRLLWKRTMAEFSGTLPEWGHAASPLIADGRLIVLPGGREAAIVALSPDTGRTLWKTPGGPATYASPIVAKLGGIRQVVAFSQYDKRSTALSGYSVATGNRLWQLHDDSENYYVVPTPTVWNGHLVIATEMNGLRMYRFGAQGTIDAEPVASSSEQFPTSVSPVVIESQLISYDGWTTCHDLQNSLKLIYKSHRRADDDHVSFIASRNRAIGLGSKGRLTLYSMVEGHLTETSRLRLFDQNSDVEIWSYPALVGDRLYLRARGRVHCLALSDAAIGLDRPIPSCAGDQVDRQSQ